jgi:1-acyl-sn-glycerol-3-phosphate acyltransferase
MRRLLLVPPLQRRLVVIPAVVAATLVALLASPFLAAGAVVVDLLTGPRRMRASRLLAFGLNYLLLECGALLVGLALWLVTGCGLALRSKWSLHLHAGVERWWVTSVMRATQRWMAVEIRVEGLSSMERGHMVVAAQHSSFFDAVLPAVLLAWAGGGVVPRYTLKRELLLSPALDVFGNRLPNHFVDRTPVLRSAELEAFHDLAGDLGRDAVVVFPEGTFHNDDRSRRAIERIRRSDPDRALRVDGLANVLPLRPGGISAVLDAAPSADVVMIGHHGFQPFGSMKSIVANIPFRDPVTVRVWRFDATDIPDDGDERLRFLDEKWVAVDRWITDTVACDGRSTG